MNAVLVIHGPNLNLLGVREPEVYGSVTLADINASLAALAKELGLSVECFQSNHEGDMVEKIGQSRTRFQALIINPAAYTHTSVAILDALKAVSIPAVEVHISDVDAREPFRQTSYAGMACVKTIKGHGLEGYREAMLYLKERYG